MRAIVKYISRFVVLVLLQVLILNQLEVGWGIQLMVYPLFILLLPVELDVIYLMLIAFGMGMLIDSMSNTFGLHASALLTVAYLRPIIFRAFAPRDGYELNVETNIHEMGNSWFIQVFGILLLIHHFSFFMLEMFKLNEILFVLQKTGLSFVLSLILCILLQFLLIKKKSSE